MPVTETHAPGTFCWIELGTTDVDGARAFYTSLFPWTVQENSMGEMGTYSIFQKDGRDAASMYKLGPQQMGMPPCWMSYVSVADVEETVAAAGNLGGVVIAGPFDVMDHGRMAVLTDPQGAFFSIWQPKNTAGIGVRDEPGTLCWNELSAHDVEGSKTFYSGLFGWRMKESPDYTEWHAGDQAVGGMLPAQAPEHVPPYWLPYFAVDDCDAALAEAGRLGGRVLFGPMDIEHVGRFGVIADPQGAAFAVIRLTM